MLAFQRPGSLENHSLLLSVISSENTHTPHTTPHAYTHSHIHTYKHTTYHTTHMHTLSHTYTPHIIPYMHIHTCRHTHHTHILGARVDDHCWSPRCSSRCQSFWSTVIFAHLWKQSCHCYHQPRRQHNS